MGEGGGSGGGEGSGHGCADVDGFMGMEVVLGVAWPTTLKE